MSYHDYALMCKALSDSTRAEIFDMLKSGKLCACKILEKFDCTQPTLSYHMKMLVDSGLVISEKEGKWCHYSINIEALEQLAMFVAKPICNCNGGCCENS